MFPEETGLQVSGTCLVLMQRPVPAYCDEISPVPRASFHFPEELRNSGLLKFVYFVVMLLIFILWCVCVVLILLYVSVKARVLLGVSLLISTF